MGRGGPRRQSHPKAFDMRAAKKKQKHCYRAGTVRARSVRAISTARLWRSRLCTCGLSTSWSLTALEGSLISGRVSRLDAFSAYPCPTWLPGGAAGATTGTPEVGPARSSRTKARSPQTSNAHHR